MDNCEKCERLGSCWFPSNNCKTCNCFNCPEDILECFKDISNRIFKTKNPDKVTFCKRDLMEFWY